MRCFRNFLLVIVSCGFPLWGFSQAHRVPDQPQHKRLIKELENQSSRLRTIERLLKMREAQMAAQQISQETHQTSPNSQAEQARSLKAFAAEFNHWLETLILVCQQKDLNQFEQLSTQAPGTMAVLMGLERCETFQTPLTGLLASYLRHKPDALDDVMAWLMIEPNSAAVELSVQAIVQQQMSGLLSARLHDPVRKGELHFSRAFRHALYHLSVNRAVDRSLRQQMLADLQRLLVYGEDRVYTHDLLSQYYQRLPDRQEDWRQIVNKAWFQSSLNLVEAQRYAPLAAQTGVKAALLFWLNEAEGQGQSLSGLQKLVDTPSGTSLSVFIRTSKEQLYFDPNKGRYGLSH